MIQTTLNGQTVFLLGDEPNWANNVELSASIPTHNEAGLTNIEARRSKGDTLRLALAYSCLLSGTALPTFRNALQSLNTQRVLCPFWPYSFDAGTMPAISADYYVLIGDGAAPVIQPASALPFPRAACPLMFGRLDGVPEPEAITDTLALVQIEFVENDTHPLTPAAFIVPQTFPAAGVDRPLFPFVPEWSKSPKSGSATVQMDQRALGQGRVLADAFYAQPNVRKVEQNFLFQQCDWINLLRFFLDNADVNGFWLGGNISEAALTADVMAAATSLSVDNPNALGSNKVVLLSGSNARLPVVVSGVVGNQWDLSSPTGQAFSANDTRLETLLFCRLDKSTLAIDFREQNVASATIQFCEMPWETAAVLGETLGATNGALPPYAYLYVFTVNYPGSPQTWRFTGFERDLIFAGDTYTAASIEHDDIKETATIERQSVSIKSRTFAGNPLSLMIPFALEWPLMIDIFEVEIAGNMANNSRALFSGEVSLCESDGPFITATANSLSSIFDRAMPRTLFQTGCNWSLFDACCGLNKDSWKWTGAVTGYLATISALSLSGVNSSNGAALIANFFAGGYVAVGSGANQQYRMIVGNTAASGGNLNLTVATPFLNIPANGSTVTFYPGCNGQRGTCTNKFSNFPNFGGFPFMPVANPSALMNAPTNNPAGGGKK